ncbi:MAG: hypothetical protein NTW33_02780 [Methanoregula sp.]|nr:hypothetical protein [Methanoregula sp.]
MREHVPVDFFGNAGSQRQIALPGFFLIDEVTGKIPETVFNGSASVPIHKPEEDCMPVKLCCTFFLARIYCRKREEFVKNILMPGYPQ